jgi:phage-related protein
MKVPDCVDAIVRNGFQKKTKKTPKSEVELAEKLKKQYFDEKSDK